MTRGILRHARWWRPSESKSEQRFQTDLKFGHTSGHTKVRAERPEQWSVEKSTLMVRWHDHVNPHHNDLGVDQIRHSPHVKYNTEIIVFLDFQVMQSYAANTEEFCSTLANTGHCSPHHSTAWQLCLYLLIWPDSLNCNPSQWSMNPPGNYFVVVPILPIISPQSPAILWRLLGNHVCWCQIEPSFWSPSTIVTILFVNLCQTELNFNHTGVLPCSTAEGHSGFNKYWLTLFRYVSECLWVSHMLVEIRRCF